MVFKQTFLKQLAVWRFTLVVLILFAIGFWYFDFDDDYIKIIGAFFLIITLPALYLHVEYILRSDGALVELIKNEIFIDNGKNQNRISNKEIASIVIYRSANMDGIGYPRIQTEYFNFARITTNSGREFILTCFLGSEFTSALKDNLEVPTIVKRSFFCSTFMR
jgi:hypothetical protein